MFIVGVGMLAAFVQNTEPLAADPNRDRMLHGPIQEFFAGTITAEELRSAMDDYARQFEDMPYKVGRIDIDLSRVPENRLRQWERLLSRLIGPTLRAFNNGTITPTEAALKVAPFVLVFGGPYGFDPATGPYQSEELTRKIGEFAAP